MTLRFTVLYESAMPACCPFRSHSWQTRSTCCCLCNSQTPRGCDICAGLCGSAACWQAGCIVAADLCASAFHSECTLQSTRPQAKMSSTLERVMTYQLWSTASGSAHDVVCGGMAVSASGPFSPSPASTLHTCNHRKSQLRCIRRLVTMPLYEEKLISPFAVHFTQDLEPLEPLVGTDTASRASENSIADGSCYLAGSGSKRKQWRLEASTRTAVGGGGGGGGGGFGAGPVAKGVLSGE